MAQGCVEEEPQTSKRVVCCSIVVKCYDFGGFLEPLCCVALHCTALRISLMSGATVTMLCVTDAALPITQLKN